MPTYTYHCATNGRTLEVKHRMSESVSTWGELCAAAGLAQDGTPAESPVAKVLRPTFVAGGKGDELAGLPGGSTGGCHGGACGHSH